MKSNRALDWLKQAENDLIWATDTLKDKHFAQACFVSQQVGEKSLKALAYSKDIDIVKSHSIMAIARSLKINGDIEKMGKRLDLYYISARYPDAFPSGAPFEYFTEDQATEALNFAGKIIEYVKRSID